MRCSFCCDPLENHIEAFVSDFECNDSDYQQVAICGTCVVYMELLIHRKRLAEWRKEAEEELAWLEAWLYQGILE